MNPYNVVNPHISSTQKQSSTFTFRRNKNFCEPIKCRQPSNFSDSFNFVDLKILSTQKLSSTFTCRRHKNFYQPIQCRQPSHFVDPTNVQLRAFVDLWFLVDSFNFVDQQKVVVSWSFVAPQKSSTSNFVDLQQYRLLKIIKFRRPWYTVVLWCRRSKKLLTHKYFGGTCRT